MVCVATNTSLILIGFYLIWAPAAFAQSNASISEITFEETSSWVGPLRKIIIRKDKTATFIEPDWHPDRLGSTIYCGRFQNFKKLAESLKAQRFFAYKSSYAQEDIMDANLVEITVVRSGKRKTVSDYARAGPSGLLFFEGLMERIIQEIKWTKVKTELNHVKFSDVCRGNR